MHSNDTTPFGVKTSKKRLRTSPPSAENNRPRKIKKKDVFDLTHDLGFRLTNTRDDQSPKVGLGVRNETDSNMLKLLKTKVDNKAIGINE